MDNADVPTKTLGLSLKLEYQSVRQSGQTTLEYFVILLASKCLLEIQSISLHVTSLLDLFLALVDVLQVTSSWVKDLCRRLCE